MVSKLVGFQVSNLCYIFFSGQMFHMINTNYYQWLFAMQICSSSFGGPVLCNIQTLWDFVDPRYCILPNTLPIDKNWGIFCSYSAVLPYLPVAPIKIKQVQSTFIQLFFRGWEARGSSLPLNTTACFGELLKMQDSKRAWNSLMSIQMQKKSQGFLMEVDTKGDVSVNEKIKPSEKGNYTFL